MKLHSCIAKCAGIYTKATYLLTEAALNDVIRYYTCAYGHIPIPGAVLGAGSDGRAVLLHPVSRLTLEGDVLSDGEVLSVPQAVRRHPRVPTVYHCGMEIQISSRSGLWEEAIEVLNLLTNYGFCALFMYSG